MIHQTSCHPIQHKISSINYLVNRLNTYLLEENEKKKEKDTIRQMIKQNHYLENAHINQKLNNKYKKKTSKNNQNNKKEKWAIFTYSGYGTQKITTIFKDTKLKIAYRTNSTLQKHLLHKKIKIDKYENSGIYRMKCLNCPRQYIGRTGRSFKTRFKEHIRELKYNTDSSTYAQHISNTGHEYGSIENAMDIINVAQKGRLMNTLEKFQIYCTKKEDTHMNEVIFDILYEHQKESSRR
jgi:hypothetical protein